MNVVMKTFDLKTKAKCGIFNITDKVRKKLKETKLKNGIVCVHVAGSTGGISTLEFEPGLAGKDGDISTYFEKTLPYNKDYKHHQTWGDGNGSGHVRSFLVGTSQTIPFQNGQMVLGTWQQLVFCEFDEHDRKRTIYCQFMGV